MPTQISSAQAWFIMVTAFTLMGIGFLIQGQLKKTWLQHLYNNNLAIFKSWVERGVLSEDCITNYQQFGPTIEALQEPVSSQASAPIRKV